MVALKSLNLRWLRVWLCEREYACRCETKFRMSNAATDVAAAAVYVLSLASSSIFLRL